MCTVNLCPLPGDMENIQQINFYAFITETEKLTYEKKYMYKTFTQIRIYITLKNRQEVPT